MKSTINKPLAIITGASSGIGAAAAKLFSLQGHPLLLIARRLENLEALALPNTLCKKVDVTDYKSFNTAVNEAEEIYGPADVIVNNAGMMLLGDIATQDPDEWRKMFEVNILGLLNGMSIVLSKMKERQGGTIINISSVAGRKTLPNHAAYCGTKFGVHAITENAREEAAVSNVRMIIIAPGAVDTELITHTTSDKIKEDYKTWRGELGGILDPGDVANAIWYAYSQPQSVNIREIVLAPTRQQD